MMIYPRRPARQPGEGDCANKKPGLLARPIANQPLDVITAQMVIERTNEHTEEDISLACQSARAL